MVKAEFSLFQVQVEGVFGHAVEPSRAEVGFIDFYFPPEGALGFTVPRDASSEFEVDAVDRSDRKAGQFGRVGGSQVHGKCPDQTPENLLTDSGTNVVLVFNGIHRASVSLLTT